MFRLPPLLRSRRIFSSTADHSSLCSFFSLPPLSILPLRLSRPSTRGAPLRSRCSTLFPRGSPPGASTWRVFAMTFPRLVPDLASSGSAFRFVSLLAPISVSVPLEGEGVTRLFVCRFDTKCLPSFFVDSRHPVSISLQRRAVRGARAKNRTARRDRRRIFFFFSDATRSPTVLLQNLRPILSTHERVRVRAYTCTYTRGNNRAPATRFPGRRRKGDRDRRRRDETDGTRTRRVGQGTRNVDRRRLD